MAKKFTLSEEFIVQIIGPTLGVEGGESRDPRDKGGHTKFGIASRYYPEVKKADFDIYDAIAIYRKLAIENKTAHIVAATGGYDLGRAYFQFAINAPKRDAVRLLQTLVQLKTSERISIDGLWGPQTQAAVSRLAENESLDELESEYLTLCAGWYVEHAIVTKQTHYMNGWVNRVGQHYRNAVDGDKLAGIRSLVEGSAALA